MRLRTKDSEMQIEMPVCETPNGDERFPGRYVQLQQELISNTLVQQEVQESVATLQDPLGCGGVTLGTATAPVLKSRKHLTVIA